MKDPRQLFDFSGKTVLITGSSRGLGRAMADGFAAAGATVIISSRKQEACEEVAGEITAAGGKATAIAAHVGEPQALDQLIAQSLEQCGAVDVLVNNAAINPGMANLDEVDVAYFDKLNEVNLRGPWYLASRLAPKMRDAGGGAIINVISIGGLRPGAGVGVYCANKSALYALTQTMAQEWAPWNIRVNALAPGPYETRMFKSAADLIPGFREASASSTVMGRVADPEELVGSALYLAGPASSYTTGAVLLTDGGMISKPPGNTALME